MTRLLGAIVYNWPLKLAAIALATLMYGGLIVSQNTQTRPVSVPIRPLSGSQPANTTIIGSLGEVTEIRYLVADQIDVSIASSNFTATVDLSQIQPGPQPQSVRVTVQSADPRIQVQSATPAFIAVHLENVKDHDVPVVVKTGPVPDGITVGKIEQSIQTATVRGAQSDIDRVTTVQANVDVPASGINVDQDFPLLALDQLGEVVRGVDVDPATVHVTMGVFKDVRSKTVEIAPTVVGTPAGGFEVADVTASVPVVTIQGDPENLANVGTAARTLPISVDGRSADFDATVGFDLPAGVDLVSAQSVTIHVRIRPVSASRSFSAGIILAGARGDRTYSLSTGEAIVTIAGSPADLDRLSAATIELTADVGGLDVGSHEVKLTISLQAGLGLVAISPPTITITVAEGTAAPSASAAGGG